MDKKVGRPTTQPKTEQYRLRMSKDDVMMLSFCCEQTGKSKADILRLGLQKVYHELQDK